MKLATIAIEVIDDLLLSGGEGTALGLDRTVTRDVKGNLELRASHLMGVWREAGREWAVLRDTVESSPAQEWLNLAEQVFGSKRWPRQVDVEEVVTPTPSNVANAWQTTARAPWSRRPKDETLRSIEAVPAGTIFTATLSREAEDDPDINALLQGSFERLTALGGSRNRGWGRVKVTPPTEWVREKDGPALVLTSTAPKDELACLRLGLRVAAPLLITDTSVPGDLLPTTQFVPGATLRGAILSLVRKHAGDVVTKEAAGAVLFGDGLPVPAEAMQALTSLQALPVPLTLQSRKRAKDADDAPAHTVAPWWASPAEGVRAVTTATHVDTFRSSSTPEGETHKRVKDKVTLWRCGAAGPWFLHAPRINTHLRNAVQPLDHASGLRGDTDLFSEERIARGDHFVADLWLPKDWVAKLDTWLLGARLPVGRGGGRLEVIAAKEWDISGTSVAEVGAAEAVTITLTSDLAVRADDLGWCGDLGVATWQAVFGDAWPPGVAVDDAREGRLAEVSETTTLRGYNRTTGLPRWPALAIKAGSTVRLKGTAGEVAKARELLSARPALGERQEDGLGRVVLDLDIDGGAPGKVEGNGKSPAKPPARASLEQLAQRLLAQPYGKKLSRAQRHDAVAGLPGDSTVGARAWIEAQWQWARDLDPGIDEGAAKAMIAATFADSASLAKEGE